MLYTCTLYVHSPNVPCYLFTTQLNLGELHACYRQSRLMWRKCKLLMASIVPIDLTLNVAFAVTAWNMLHSNRQQTYCSPFM